MSNYIGSVGSLSVISSGSFARPADTSAYVIGDIVAQDTVAGGCSAVAFSASRLNGTAGRLKRCRVKVNNVAWLTKQVYVHVFKTAPIFTNGDNAAFVVGVSESEYLGAFDVTLDQSFSNPTVKGIGLPKTGTEIMFDTAANTTNLYFVLEIRSVVTPGTDVFTVVFEVSQD